ncbi:hypothetical protein C6988_07635 [Nitrosopumilus sp. b1]|uniref:hypothetical protein n=1 Tax=Nitrosopumilus sp. b1 TaxID=2109907 RepID=UPI0015F463DD|nr:hypothetical protein [Nitrosopumilus sp. b1]KAF6242541.1 hypothetical protein C6988_07635 [Nitrosopumilus sp. b1]
MALSFGISFYQLLIFGLSLYFERRDFILLAGSVLFVIGLMPFMPPAYAIAIGGGLFIGIKSFVVHRKKTIQKETGDGICMECGEKTVGKKCPNCD